MSSTYAVEDAIRAGGGASYSRDGEPTTVARLVRNLILGGEFLMSHITHFWQLAALDYVQGPEVPPFTPYFDDSFYIPVLLSPTASGKRMLPGGLDIDAGTTLPFPRPLPASAAINATAGSGSGQHPTYTGLDGIWDNVIVDYLESLRWRREALAVVAKLAGRTPQVQSIVAGGTTCRPTTADMDAILQVLGDDSQGIIKFLKKHQLPTVQILSYLYGDYGGTLSGDPRRKYDNDGTNIFSGYGAGVRNFLSFGVFNEANSHSSLTDPNRLLKRGYVYGEGGSPTLGEVYGDSETKGTASGTSNIVEFVYGSHYRIDTNVDASSAYFTDGIQPWSGYTDPDYDASASKQGGYNNAGYSWIKSPRILHGGTGSGNAIACQVGPLARMVVTGARGVGTGYAASANFTANAGTLDHECKSYHLGEVKSNVMHLHPYLWPIINANIGAVSGFFGPPPGLTASGSPFSGFLCGGSAMDRHRARAYEAIKIALRMKDWANELKSIAAGPASGGTYTGVNANYVPFTLPTGGPHLGRGMHEAPRGALSHWITIKDGVIENYQCVVPTTWNASPRHADPSVGLWVRGPIEQALVGFNSSTTVNCSGQTSDGKNVPVEILRVVHSFDPCIACAVH